MNIMLNTGNAAELRRGCAADTSFISRPEDIAAPSRQGGTGMNLKMKLKSLLN
jgi:hypothetical protein